ncbi:MAG: RNA polymerase sigma-70 factor [Bacteroidota bacterium]
MQNQKVNIEKNFVINQQNKLMSVPDNVIFRKIQAGDLKAFETLFKTYYPMLVDYARKYVSDVTEAEEIAQELFSNLWEKKETIEIKSSLRSYLFRAIHNNCLLFLQHKAVELKYENYIKSREIQSEPDPVESIRAKELFEKLQDTLSKLPERAGTIFKMSRFEGLKYHEIAKKLDISVKTVEANMGRVLKTLRHSLKEYTH